MSATKTDTPTSNQYLADLQREEAEQGLLRIQEISDDHKPLLNTWLTGVNIQIQLLLKNREIRNYDSFIDKFLLALDKGLEWANEVDALPEDLYHNSIIKEWLEAVFLVATVETIHAGYEAYKEYIPNAKKEIKRQVAGLEKLGVMHSSEIGIKNKEIKKIQTQHHNDVSVKHGEIFKLKTLVDKNEVEISTLKGKLNDVFWFMVGSLFMALWFALGIVLFKSWWVLLPLLLGALFIWVAADSAGVS